MRDMPHPYHATEAAAQNVAPLIGSSTDLCVLAHISEDRPELEDGAPVGI